MKVEPITQINVEGKIFDVSDLPDSGKKLVAILDDIRQKEYDVTLKLNELHNELNNELITLRYAQRAMASELSNIVQTTMLAAPVVDTPVEDGKPVASEGTVASEATPPAA